MILAIMFRSKNFKPFLFFRNLLRKFFIRRFFSSWRLHHRQYFIIFTWFNECEDYKHGPLSNLYEKCICWAKSQAWEQYGDRFRGWCDEDRTERGGIWSNCCVYWCVHHLFPACRHSNSFRNHFTIDTMLVLFFSCLIAWARVFNTKVFVIDWLCTRNSFSFSVFFSRYRSSMLILILVCILSLCRA